MSLPRRFDPEKMSFGPIPPRLWRRQNPIPDDKGRYEGKHGVARLWMRFDDAVIRLGNKIAKYDKKKISVKTLAVVYIVVEIIGLLVFAFAVLEKGLLKAFGLFLLFVLCGMGVAWLSQYVSFIVVGCLRLIFWNGWTLLLTVMTATVLLSALIAFI